jgi:carboxyl-terminal processing protease
MKNKITVALSVFLISGFLVSGCAGFVGLDEEPTSVEYGPPYSAQEHQARTFEALWSHFQENYIYYDTANVNWDSTREQYLERIKSGLTNEEFTELLRGLEEDLPQGSLAYQSRAERIETETADFSSYEGIGAFVGFDEQPEPHIVLLGVIEGSPAEQAGLKPHDSIFEIDGDPVLLEEGLDVVQRIRGPSGSSVTLHVQTPGEAARSVEVTRAKLTSTGQIESRLIDGTNYGYVLFPPVAYQALATDVANALQDFTTDQTLEGLVLDLRIANSPGGWPLDDLYSLFNEGLVGEFYQRRTDDVLELEVQAQDVSSSQTVPLVILIGKNTAGFPEIFAAGLQKNERATLIGEPTPGAVETASPFYLPDGSQVFIEITSFRLVPNDGEIGNSGVQPDILVEADWDEIAPDADPVLDAAVETLGSQS